MDLHLLELFLRVAELGSINRAAQTLSLSQPALSRHIGALEHEMGVPLFSRHKNGVRLTPAGQLLNERSRPLLRQFMLLKEQVGEQAAGQLAIGLPPAWHALVTAPFTQAFTERHPGVKLRIHEGLSNVLHDSMAAGLLDMAVVPFRTLPMAGYVQTALVREPVVLVGRAADRFDAHQPVPLGRLEGARLVVPSRPNVLRLQLEHALQRKGIGFQLAVEADALSICLDLARRGVGWSVMPMSSLAAGSARQDLSWAPIRGQQVSWALQENEARAHSPALRQGRKVLQAAIEQVLGQGEWTGAERLAAPGA